MKRLFRYSTLILLLFVASQRAVAGNPLPVSESGKAVPQQAELTDTGNGQHTNDHLLLADHGLLTSLCEHAPSSSQASKRSSFGKDFLYAKEELSDPMARVFSSYEQKYPGTHTRYFFILFPYHFFW